MSHKFNTLIDSYIENQVGISDHFLTEKLAFNLSENLLKLFANKQMKKAGIGNDIIQNSDKLFRSDSIFWLDKIHNDIYENEFFVLMDEFVKYLNETCYTGITGYEFHYTMYENGDFYKKHLDQFKNNDRRKFSLITYLNVDWKIADGGELIIYHEHSQQNISPNNCKSIFFKSNELAHEVLLTNKPRMSITGWLKSD